MINIKKIKKEFPASNKPFVYLDSACSALKMKSSADAQMRFLLDYGSCGGKRAVYKNALMVEELYESARSDVANFINSQMDEIVFTSGTTDGFNILANSFKFKTGDEIIISGLEHNSVFLPFYRISKEKGLKLKIIPIKNYQPSFDEFKKLVNKRTRVLCISKASNFFGGTVRTEEIVSYAKKCGIKVFFDCAQYVSSHSIDVKALGADAIAFSGHKIGAPYGTGVLYINDLLYNFLNSSAVGGGTVKDISISNGKIDVRFLNKFYNFEGGIQNYSGAYALSVAIRKLDEISYFEIRKHISSLVKYAVSELNKIDGINIIGDELEEGSIISFTSINKNFSYPDFSMFLSGQSKPVSVRYGKLCADLASINTGIKSVIRLSFFVYNTEDDVNYFIRSLKKYLKLID
jgi:selenocysteine lyase/cysteine desulfurase